MFSVGIVGEVWGELSDFDIGCDDKCGENADRPHMTRIVFVLFHRKSILIDHLTSVAITRSSAL